MQFKGQLLLPGEPGPGLQVDLDVAEHHLAVESDGGGLGAWPLEVVDVARLQGDVFALTVAGESLQFVADDTIGFAYSGVPTIERVSKRSPRTRSALRSMLDRIWNGPEDAAPPVPDQQKSHVGSPEPELTFEERLARAYELMYPEEPDNAGSAVMGVEDVIETGNETIPPIRDETPEPWAVGEETNNSFDPTPLPGADAPESSEVVKEPAPAGCPVVRDDGRPCESEILTATGYCHAHDPRRAFEDRYQEAQEARAQLKRDATGRLNRIYRRLDMAMRQVERGELDPETAMAMAHLARTMCAILDLDEPPADDR
jgi:hypothetical protein